MRRGIVFLAAALAACSPANHKTSRTPANAPAQASQGHTPLPVQDANAPLLFHGYACGTDCSVHQAGYAWGANHSIANPADCRGTSEEFIEGCRAFAGVDGPMGQQEIFQDED